MGDEPVEKKKHFRLLPAVKDFLRDQPGDVKQELNGIIWKLETEGTLSAPYGEKVSGDDRLFAIRVIQTGNIRVFYVYGILDNVIGLYGYVKKTEEIPQHELDHAKKIVSQLIAAGVVK